MSNCKLLLFFGIVLAVVITVQSQARVVCNRGNKFENIKQFSDYMDCLKSQVSTRYGKRGQPFLLGRLRPDFPYTDYENKIAPPFDVLFTEN